MDGGERKLIKSFNKFSASLEKIVKEEWKRVKCKNGEEKIISEKENLCTY